MVFCEQLQPSGERLKILDRLGKGESSDNPNKVFNITTCNVWYYVHEHRSVLLYRPSSDSKAHTGGGRGGRGRGRGEGGTVLLPAQA